MSFYLAAVRAIPGDACAPTEPCIPTDPCAPTDPCINERLLSTLPSSFSDVFTAQAEASSMSLWGPGDPCTLTDPCIDAQPTDLSVDAQPGHPCFDAMPGDPCRYTLPLASLGHIHDLAALNPQPLPPQEAPFTMEWMPAATSLSHDAEIEMLNLQSLMSSRQQALQLCTNMVVALGDSAQRIASNVGK